jgi:hypothetical protein
MSDETAIEADILRCGYNVGYFDNADIARWADRQIEASDIPSTELLDLSMNRETHPIDVMNLLRSFGLPAPSTTIQTQIGFIGLLIEKKKISAQLAIRRLFELVHEPGMTQEEKMQIYYVDDGYSFMEDIEERLFEFLGPYAKQLGDQYPHLIHTITRD